MSPYRIFHIEDSETDAELTLEALTEVASQVRVTHFLNAELALDALLRGVVCDMVFVDLNMPIMNGFKFIEAVRNTEVLRTLPILVLTNSRSNEDMNRAYGLGANGYILKPLDYNQLVDIMTSLYSFWFKVVALPTRSVRGHSVRPKN